MSTFRNPVLPGFYPDPSICRVGEDYYLVNSSFGYFPGVPIFHSRDLVNWQQIGHVLSRESQVPLEGADVSGGGIYAPTIRHHGGRFYMITTNVSSRGNFIVTAEKPEGPWSDPVWIETPGEGGIDPSLFFDNDGSAYFTGTGNNRLRLFKIDVATGKPLDEARAIWPGTGGQYAEAPHLFRVGDYYYVTLAEGGTEYGHMQTIARSKSLEGPWESCPHNPILTHRSRLSPLHAVGHSDFVQGADGRWFVVFHAIRPQGYPFYHVCGRETCVAAVEWVDGWPVVNDGRLISGDLPDLGLPRHPWPVSSAREDFDKAALGFRWAYIRNPVAEHYDFKTRPGWLGLVPSTDPLNGKGRPTFVGQRQTQPTAVASAHFDFRDLEPGDEAGLTVLQRESHHYEVFARRTASGLCLVVRRQVADLMAEVAITSAPSEALTLQIRAEPETYDLGYLDPSGAFVSLAKGTARLLGTEVAGAFTGCFFGLFAQAAMPRSKAGAWVDWFEIRSE